jgi:hypothetical protein
MSDARRSGCWLATHARKRRTIGPYIQTWFCRSASCRPKRIEVVGTVDLDLRAPLVEQRIEVPLAA